MEKAAAEIGPGGSTQADRIAQSKVIGATEHSQTELSSMKWEEGEATVHASTLLHGVARMGNGVGVRYSLIIFVGTAG